MKRLAKTLCRVFSTRTPSSPPAPPAPTHALYLWSYGKVRSIIFIGSEEECDKRFWAERQNPTIKRSVFELLLVDPLTSLPVEERLALLS